MKPAGRPAARGSLLLAAALLLAGCGSTVQPRDSALSGSGSLAGGNGNVPTGQGLGPAASGSTTGTAVAGSTGAVVPGPGSAGASDTATGGTGAVTSTTGGTTGAAAALPAKGKGWDEHFVDIGVVTNQDISDFAGTLGVNTLDSGNQKADAEAMIAELNAHGGLYGRKLRGVYYDVSSASDKESASQAVCTYFTQDHPVIVVIDGAVQNDTDSFRACMRKAKTVVLGAGAQPFDDKVFNDLQGWYYQLPYASWSVFGPALIRQLNADKYFTGWDTANGQPGSAPVKVGILSLDTPVLHRIVDLLQTNLRKIGHASDDVFYARTQEDLQAAVLRFRSDNVTHVLDTDQFLFAFMNNADSQHYRPRYGISTPNAPGLLLQGTAPAAQLAGAVGLGYFPTLDVDADNDPGSAVAGAAPCRQMFAKHGLTYARDKRFALAYQYLFCDALQLVASATQRAGGFTGDQVRMGVEMVGSSLKAAFTFRNALSPTVRTEPGAALALDWNATCSCFRYRGSLISL